MQRRILGRTGLEVSCLGFGGWPIQQLVFNPAKEVIYEAFLAGIDFFDTSQTYGDSEVNLGFSLNLKHHEAIVSTKTAYRTKEAARSHIGRSLRNLRTDRIDIFHLENVSRDEDVSQVLAEDGALAALKEAQKEGIIRFIGVSGHRPEALIYLIETGEFDVVQFPVNVVDLDFMENVIPVARKHNVGVIGAAPFVSGSFGDAEIAIGFALSQDIAVTIPGMQSIAEVDDNARVAKHFKPLFGDEYLALQERAHHLCRSYCRMCGDCLPCPQGVDIPGILGLERDISRFHLRDWAEKAYAHMPVKASACDRCALCEPRCPYGVPIMDMIDRMGTRLSRAHAGAS
ncbi:MAG: aldo/keto reductase [Armatimonadetes bacterium]|nr:aldo/keto reductase [Armatimonadota bacterium]